MPNQALKMAVTEVVLTPNTETTVDFTVPGFGTPTAAIFFMNYGISDSVENEATFLQSIGFTDGTNQRCIASTSENNSNPTDGSRSQLDTVVIAQLYHGDGSIYKYGTFNSWIEDGVRLNWYLNAGTVSMSVFAVLFKGSPANVTNFSPNTSQDGSASATSQPFRPDLMFCICAGTTDFDDGSTQNLFSLVNFGCANETKDGTIQQRANLFASTGGVSPSKITSRLETDAIIGQVYNENLNWTLEIDSFDANGWTATTRDGASGGDMVAMLILQKGDSIGNLETINTIQGNEKISTSFIPEGIILNRVLAEGNAVDTTETTAAYWYSAGADKKSSNESSIEIYDRDNVSTSYCWNQWSSSFLDLTGGTVPTTELVKGSISSWDSDGILLSLDTADPTGPSYSWGFILGRSSVKNKVPPRPRHSSH